MENTVSDNNKGKSESFHFFGIEVGHASTPDEPVKGLDFTASYENIVCRNIVTGSNYAGVFLAEGSYCNDVFDNTILGSEWFAIECHSTMFNSMPEQYDGSGGPSTCTQADDIKGKCRLCLTGMEIGMFHAEKR